MADVSIKDLGYSIGDQFSIEMDCRTLFWSIDARYDYLVRMGELEGERFIGNNMMKQNMTSIECTIREFIDGPNGFAPSSDFEKTVIINDLANFIPRLWNKAEFVDNLP